MKFQVELEIFKINLKIVFCVKHFISSELQPIYIFQLNLKMHWNDIITHILHQFHANSVNTIISMQTKHETLLVISIIDSFCAQFKLFCETVISLEYFPVVWENTNFNWKIFGRVLRIQHYFMKNVMFWKIWEFIQMCNILNYTIFSINQMSRWKPFLDAFNQIWTNIIFLFKKKSQYLETF